MAKVKANIDGLNDLIKSLKNAEKYKVRVGILGSKAEKEHKGTSLTNANLGAVHEFGTTIKVKAHKITTYKAVTYKKIRIKDKDGNVIRTELTDEVKGYKFKGRFRKKKNKSTNYAEDFEVGPYKINIPQRSFLEQPLKEKLPNEIKKIKQEIFKETFQKMKPRELLTRIGAKAVEIVQNAFDTGGYGQWASLTSATKRYKAKKHLSPQILRATGQLAKSISFKVIKND